MGAESFSSLLIAPGPPESATVVDCSSLLSESIGLESIGLSTVVFS